ncbi:MAG: DUF4329 domain-containing protein [Treponema sp.]|nr:DUF4329 domain-containing protein [Candidatus Treponema caballi]
MHNDPVGHVDLWGLKPGDVFNSPDEAATDFGLTYGDDSIKNNKEYGASVYKVSGGYTYTVPSVGSSDSVIMSVPPFDKVEAYLHTHAADDPKYDNENFSKTDKNTAQKKGVDIYVATPKGKLKVFNPDTGVTQVLSDTMPTNATAYNEDETIGFFKNLINHIVNFFTGNSNSKKDESYEKKNK